MPTDESFRRIQESGEEYNLIRYTIPLSSPQVALLTSLHQQAEAIRRLKENFGGHADVGMFAPFYLSELSPLADPEQSQTRKLLGWKGRKILEVARSLQGIFAIPREYVEEDVNERTRRPFHHLAIGSYEIPEENEDSVFAALETGVFEKEILLEDVPVLRAIWQFSETLRAHRGSNGSHLPPPRISAALLAEVLQTDEATVEESLYGLSGLLARTQQVFSHIRTLKEPEKILRMTANGQYSVIKRAERVRIESQRWFIPSAHRGIIEELLQSYAK